MESLKSKDVSFSEIINKINAFSGTIEPSFSSKMLATLNTDMPVWDQYVLSNAGIEKPKSYSITIDECIKTYEKVVAFYSKLLENNQSKEMIKLFNEKLPLYKHFTPIKKKI